MNVKRSRSITEILLFFAAFFLPGYAAQGAFAPSPSATSLLMLQSILTGIPQFLLMAWVVTVRDDSTPARWGIVRVAPRDALHAAVLVAACFAAVMAFVAMVLALPEAARGVVGGGYRWGLQGAGQLPLAVLFGLTTGYREEFFFRSYLLGRLDELGFPVAGAVAVSTAAFCLGHLYEGPLAIAVTAVLGLLLSAAWIRWKNLHVIAVSHACYNTLVLCLTLVIPRTLPTAGFWRIF